MEKIESRGKLTPLSPPSPQPDPVFASAHAALKFALNFSHGTLKKNFLAQAQGGGAPGRGLGGLDGAAQAGMILAELGNLSSVRRYIQVGRFAPPSTPCACRSQCCSGARETPAWTEAVDYLTEYALAAGLTGTISHYRLRRALVMRYLGVRGSFVAMAAACHVNRDTASDNYRRFAEHFKTEERHGFYEIEGRLKAAGIIAA